MKKKKKLGKTTAQTEEILYFHEAEEKLQQCSSS